LAPAGDRAGLPGGGGPDEGFRWDQSVAVPPAQRWAVGVDRSVIGLDAVAPGPPALGRARTLSVCASPRPAGSCDRRPPMCCDAGRRRTPNSYVSAPSLA